MDGYFHVWFSTKARKETLDGNIGVAVKRVLKDIAAEHHIRLIEVEAAVDHVHALVCLEGAQTLSSVMHQLKGASARHIFLEYPELDWT